MALHAPCRTARFLERHNHKVYQRSRVARGYGDTSGWLEDGERNAVMSVAEAVRGAPILDIGVGGARTTPLLRAISDDYLGIDYASEMLLVAHRRYPDCAFSLMDACSLDLADDQFGLVLFSYNGIDSVGPAARQTILHEVVRVLRPGGYFVFSALNERDAANAQHWPDWSVFHDVHGSWGAARAVARLVIGGGNHLWGRCFAQGDGDTAIGSISAHNFALLTVFTSLPAQLRQLHEAGLRVSAIYGPDGNAIAPDDDADGTAPWYHFVAQKPAA